MISTRNRRAVERYFLRVVVAHPYKHELAVRG